VLTCSSESRLLRLMTARKESNVILIAIEGSTVVLGRLGTQYFGVRNTLRTSP
jgi:hypothetical protein